MLPSSGISEYLGLLVRNMFFNDIFKKHPKVSNLGAFSTFFLKTGEKNHQICQKFDAFPTLLFFILFFEMGQLVRVTQDSFCWPNG